MEIYFDDFSMLKTLNITEVQRKNIISFVRECQENNHILGVYINDSSNSNHITLAVITCTQENYSPIPEDVLDLIENYESDNLYISNEIEGMDFPSGYIKIYHR